MKGHTWTQGCEWTQQELNLCERMCMDMKNTDIVIDLQLYKMGIFRVGVYCILHWLITLKS